METDWNDTTERLYERLEETFLVLYKIILFHFFLND